MSIVKDYGQIPLTETDRELGRVRDPKTTKDNVRELFSNGSYNNLLDVAAIKKKRKEEKEKRKKRPAKQLPSEQKEGNKNDVVVGMPTKDEQFDKNQLHPKMTKYRRIKAGQGFFTSICHYFAFFFVHFHRAFLVPSLLHNVASVSERRHILSKLTEKDIGTACFNLLTWRRSALVIMLVTTFLMAGFSTHDAYKSILHSNYVRELALDAPQVRLYYPEDKNYISHEAIEYLDLEDPSLGANFQYENGTFREPFWVYSERIFKMGLCKMMRDSVLMVAVVSSAVALMCWVAVLCNLVSLGTWSKYPLSRKWLAVGWFATFVAPFLISVMPYRLFLRWEGFDDLQENYYKEFREYYQIEEKEQQAIEMCHKIMYEVTFDDVEDIIEQVCGNDGSYKDYPSWRSDGIVEKYLPKKVIDFDYLFGSIYVDCRPVHRSCGRTRQYMIDGDYKDALLEAQEGCRELVSILQGQRGGTAADLMNMMKDGIDRMKQVAEITASLIHALSSFKNLLPAAVAIAPALLRGALKAKTVVPQSSIPGMFIIILPWLYCPIIWTVYNVIFQLMGNIYLLIALLIMAYSPMIYFFVGVSWQVTKPMSDALITKVMRIMKFSSTFSALTAYGFLVAYLTVDDDRQSYASSMVNDFVDPVLLGTVAVSAISKFLYTTVTSVDFILLEIVSQRKYERLLENDTDLVQSMLKGKGSHKSKEEWIRNLAQHRQYRLDQFVDMSSGSMWKKKKKKRPFNNTSSRRKSNTSEIGGGPGGKLKPISEKEMSTYSSATGESGDSRPLTPGNVTRPSSRKGSCSGSTKGAV